MNSVRAKSTRRRTPTAFIAMAMGDDNPRLDDVLDAIKQGARAAGVKASRLDEAASNLPIMARILSAIERCDVIIVDLTFERTNVYYEAGFAQGIGKTPVYIAECDVQIPFDLKDYPIILYKNLRTLRRLLAERLRGLEPDCDNRASRKKRSRLRTDRPAMQR